MMLMMLVWDHSLRTTELQSNIEPLVPDSDLQRYQLKFLQAKRNITYKWETSYLRSSVLPYKVYGQALTDS